METLSVSTGQGTSFELPIAGLGARSYAFVIDWHIRTLLALAWLFLWILLIDINESLSDNFSEIIDTGLSSVIYIIFVPAIVIYFFYHPILEIMMRGQTPGKRMANIRIVTGEGHSPSVGSHLIRNVFRIIDSMPSLYCFGIIACLSNKRQLRLGDLAANTVLVYEENMEEAAIQDVERFLNEGKLTLNQLQTIRDVISRWHILDKEVRVKLARKLLHKANLENEYLSHLSDAELLVELKQMIDN